MYVTQRPVVCSMLQASHALPRPGNSAGLNQHAPP